jgi:hypothetical protein
MKEILTTKKDKKMGRKNNIFLQVDYLLLSCDPVVASQLSLWLDDKFRFIPIFSADKKDKPSYKLQIFGNSKKKLYERHFFHFYGKNAHTFLIEENGKNKIKTFLNKAFIRSPLIIKRIDIKLLLNNVPAELLIKEQQVQCENLHRTEVLGTATKPSLAINKREGDVYFRLYPDPDPAAEGGSPKNNRINTIAKSWDLELSDFTATRPQDRTSHLHFEIELKGKKAKLFEADCTNLNKKFFLARLEEIFFMEVSKLPSSLLTRAVCQNFTQRIFHKGSFFNLPSSYETLINIHLFLFLFTCWCRQLENKRRGVNYFLVNILDLKLADCKIFFSISDLKAAGLSYEKKKSSLDLDAELTVLLEQTAVSTFVCPLALLEKHVKIGLISSWQKKKKGRSWEYEVFLDPQLLLYLSETRFFRTGITELFLFQEFKKLRASLFSGRIPRYVQPLWHNIILRWVKKEPRFLLPVEILREKGFKREILIVVTVGIQHGFLISFCKRNDIIFFKYE